jgi:hypothetical protein
MKPHERNKRSRCVCEEIKGETALGKIKVLFWFDVEDFINEESEEGLVGLLDLLDRRGIIGIFKLVGEKVRMLERRSRTDILDRLKRHEIGYHTDWHSVHPVTTEYLEPLGFRAGAEEFERREVQGFADLQRITGQPVLCYGQPGQAWAPQPFAVLNKWGVPVYLDGHDQIQFDGRPFWYGGMLNMTSLTGLMSMPLEQGALEQAKQRFDQLCEEQGAESVGFISLFYHPTEFVFSEFWDAVNFFKGNNPPPSEWVKPRLRPEGDMHHYLDQVGAFVDYTLSKENVEYVGTAELLRLEASEVRALTAAEVQLCANQIGTELSYLVHGRLTLSAGEIFWIFRAHLLGLEPLPEIVYGPEQELPCDSGQTVKAADVLEAIQQDLPDVCGFKQMPDYFEIRGQRVSPVVITCALAAIIREGLDLEEELVLTEAKLAAEAHASQNGAWAKYWVIFPENLEIRRIINMSRLQTWTLKPALF